MTKPLFFTICLGIGLVLAMALRFSDGGRQLVAGFMDPFLKVRLKVSDELDMERRAMTKVELIMENDKLRAENEALALHMRQFRSDQEENAELRRLLLIEQSAPGPQWIIARILSRDAAAGGGRYRIDRGSLDGVTTGSGVLVQGVVMGRVAEVSKRNSLVFAVTDPNCRISVTIPEAGVEGVMSGRAEDTFARTRFCDLSYLPRDVQYKAGQEVVTSRFSRAFPPSVPIGVCQPAGEREMVTVVDNLYKISTVRPALNDLTFTWVTIWLGE